MRQINVSTQVFSMIWAARHEGEESEDEILARVLGGRKTPKAAISTSREDDGVRITWIDDVREALANLNGKAHLSALYREVEKIRRAAGRSIPKNLDAVVRRTLEDNCKESSNFRGRSLFVMVEGKGAGVWGLE